MKAWAIELESNSQRRLLVVLAETKNEAFAKAFDEMEDALAKDPGSYKEKNLKDYRVSLWSYVEIPQKMGGTTTPAVPGHGPNSGFDNEIKNI